jgi:aryl-alcohol dehydrogenase-like predicted oxidoreductase
MKYTHLGRTGMLVSRLCLGTMNLGVSADEQESFRIMDRALELGINFFDTADRYGNPQGDGGTEEIIGRWLAQGNRRRENIVLGTKVFGPMGRGPNDRGLSIYHLRQGCNDSLRRMQTDHVDLYQMHHVDRGAIPANHQAWLGKTFDTYYPPYTTPGPRWEEIWQGMEQLYREGKILYVGSSNFAAWNIAQANEIASRREFMGLVSEQSVYNLTSRMIELEVIPACRAYGMGLMLYSPLAGGLLAGSAQKPSQGGRRANLKLSDSQRAQWEEYDALCRELGEEPANVALAWLLHNPVVTSPIIGPRTVQQMESAMRALDIELSPEILARLDSIFPGPGDQAPEAYAW